MCLMFAATYPARTSALILYGTFARALRAADYPLGLPVNVLEAFRDWAEKTWGTGAPSADFFAPNLAGDEGFRRSWARFERYAVSPAGIKALLGMLHETDARQTLSVIRVPTLVVHRQGDQVTRVEGAHRRTYSGRQIRRTAGKRSLPLGRRYGQRPERSRRVRHWSSSRA